MAELQLQKEQSLRFAAPRVYQTMMDSFKKFNIHPFDVQGTVLKTSNVLDITIRSAINFSEIAKISISEEQAKEPDKEVADLFKEAAQSCKNQLITNYYKMIKL